MHGTVRIAALAAIAVSTQAVAETLPPGGKVNKAVTANVTPDGIDFLLDQGIGLLPDQITVPQTSGSQSCLFSTLNYTVYQGSPTNGVDVNITSATVSPQSGYFNLSIAGTVVGTGTDQDGNGNTHTFAVTRVEYSGCGTSCNNDDWSIIRLNATPFAVTTTLDLQLMTDPVTGEPYVEATTTLDRDDISLNLNGLDAAGCAAIDLIVSAVKPFITNFVKDEIIKAVNEDLLPAVEEGFGSLRFDDVVDLAGAQVHMKIVPSALDIRPNGVAVSMSSQMDALAPTTCVPVATDAGSLFTAGEPPQWSTFSPSGGGYDAAAAISDDFVNQALFTVWHAGLFCQTIEQVGDGALTIDMLSLAGLSGPLNRLGIEDGSPMVVVIKGYEPPTATFADDPHVTLGLRRLEVSIFTIIHDRMARLVALELEADAGANVLFDAANVLSLALDIAPDDVTGAVSYDELVNGEDAAALLDLLPVIVGQFLPTVTDSLPTIDLGSLAGVGLENPEVLAEQGYQGVPNDTLSFYTGLVATGGGCGATTGGGCGVSGGGSGCSMGGGPAASQLGWLALALTPLAVILRRRRQG